MKKLLLTTLTILSNILLHSQCILLPNAVADMALVHQNTNCFNNSGVAYNPLLNLYYGVRAGNSSFPLETWTATGTPLFQTSAGFDWRGMWWNPVTNQLEGNGYNTGGLWKADLNGTGYALNTGTTLFSGMNQPDPQSCGDLDPVAYEVLYYFNGSVYRYSRTTNAFLGSYPLTGTPTAIANLNWTTLMYTGCVGKEIALLDYVNKAIYVYNKATGAYAGTSLLPASAVTTNGFRTSWANCRVWLFNLSNYTWNSYKIFDQCASCSAVFTNINAPICPGDSVFAGGSWQTNAGMYYDTLTSSSNCDSIIVTNVTVVPAIINNQNYTICAGDSIYLGGAWQYNSGVFTDSLQSNSGCDSVVIHHLNVLLPVQTNVNHSLCFGDSIQVAGTWHHVSGNYPETFTSASGCDSIVHHLVNIQSLITSQIFTTLCYGDSLLIGGQWQHSTGVYTDTLNAVNGCDSVRTTHLTIKPPIFTSLVKNICQGDSTFLAGAWQHSSGLYTDSYTSPQGCDSLVSTTLVVQPLLWVNLGPDTAICSGQSMTLHANPLNASYLWQDFSTAPTYTVTQSGIYWVEVTSGACKARDSIRVDVTPSPMFSLGADQSLCPGDVIVLDATVNGATYKWFNFDKSATYTVTNAGTYWVEVRIKNCTASDTITIDYNNPMCDCNVYLPNAFSPNHDQLNDEFRIVNDKGVELLDFKIYNRFGNLVFKANGIHDAWDGNYHTSPEEIGTYYYLVKYRCVYSGKEYVLKGDITLVR